MQKRVISKAATVKNKAIIIPISIMGLYFLKLLIKSYI